MTLGTFREACQQLTREELTNALLHNYVLLSHVLRGIGAVGNRGVAVAMRGDDPLAEFAEAGQNVMMKLDQLTDQIRVSRN